MKNLICLLFLIPFAIFAQFHEEQNTYEYDNLNRLEKVVFHNGIVYEYNYDNLGNRLGKTLNVELDENDFTVGHQNVNGCNQGRIYILVEKRHNYHAVITNIETGVIVEFDFNNDNVTYNNLEFGEYTVCISINNIDTAIFEYCTTKTISDDTDVSHITNEDFNANVYGIFNNGIGKVTTYVYDTVECHDFNLEVHNEFGNLIYSGVLYSGDFINNLTKGIYTYCITIENIPADIFEYCFTVGLFDNKYPDYKTDAYNECNSGTILYKLPDDGYEYIMDVEDENHTAVIQQQIGSDGIYTFSVNTYTNYWGCLRMDTDYSSRFCSSLYTNDPAPFYVYYDVDYATRRLRLIVNGEILPYTIYLNNNEYNFEEFYTEYFDLEYGYNTFSINPFNQCVNSYNFSVHIPDNYSLFPNPSKHFINVFIPVELLSNNVYMDIVDVTGKKIFTQKFVVNSNVVTANISRLPNAVYFIHILSEDGKTLWGTKFIKK